MQSQLHDSAHGIAVHAATHGMNSYLTWAQGQHAGRKELREKGYEVVECERFSLPFHIFH